MKQVRFGIIGAGVLAPQYAKATSKNTQATLVAVSNVDVQKAGELAEEYGAEEVSSDIEETLEPIDVCLTLFAKWPA